MALLSVKNLSMSFGGPKLLDGVSFQIEEGQRVCLVGRNGEGKSTLLRLLSADLVPDGGEIARSSGVTVARLSQKVPEVLSGTIFEVVTEGLGNLGKVLAEYHRVAESGDVEALSRVETQLQEQGGWEALNTVETVISKLSLNPEMRFETLSGGLKRRALLARALACDPDVLLLDEPTNHLDIDSIAWLEEFLLRHVKTLVFITHDRMFLRRIATRIIELDRGRLADWSCDYDTFLKRRDDLLAAEEKEWERFDRKLAQEETWIRQGIKARRTRNEGRVRALKKMREERRQRRERQGAANFVMQEAAKTGKMVIETKDLSFSWQETPIVRDFSSTIMRGDRVGLIGPNGAGKTTFIQLLLKKLEPDTGSVRLGTNLQVAYFDQHREQLDPNKTVRDCIDEGNDTVTVNGRTKHVMGYLKDFLFAPDRANSPVSVLSGGERNRLLLARLFTRPSNVLVMDEPTNDLDAETLDLLEDRLMEYPGTVIIVSHDRAFLNNVVTSTIAFEGGGRVAEYVGGYDDWLRQRPGPVKGVLTGAPKSAPKSMLKDAQQDAPGQESRKETSQAPAKKKKLGFKEQREKQLMTEELAGLPARIEALEAKIEAVNERMSQPDFFKQPLADTQRVQAELEVFEAELEAVFSRWEEVEAKLEEYARYD